MSTQRTHDNTLNVSKTFPIVLLCDGVNSPSNIGSLFRICDALGVSEIIFCNSELNIKSAKLQKTSRSTHKKVAYSKSNSILDTLEEFKKNDFELIALEITTNSISIEKLSLATNKKILLVIGNEQQGISEEVLRKTHLSIHIDMYGENSSMNVVQATSIALYSIINKLYIY